MVTVVLLEPVRPASTEFVRALASTPDVWLYRSMDALRGSSPDVIVIHHPNLDDAAADVAALRQAHPRSLVLLALPGRVVADALAAVVRALGRANATSRPDEEAVTAAAAAVQRLSPIERHILRMIAGGLTNPEIAHHLGLASQTVKNYVSALFTKLRVSRRTQAAVLFVRASMGVIDGAYSPEDDDENDDDRIAVLMRELQAGIDRIDRVADRIAATATGARRDHSRFSSGTRPMSSAPVILGHRRPG